LSRLACFFNSRTIPLFLQDRKDGDPKFGSSVGDERDLFQWLGR
jgi:hypothetical protein